MKVTKADKSDIYQTTNILLSLMDTIREFDMENDDDYYKALDVSLFWLNNIHKGVIKWKNIMQM